MFMRAAGRPVLPRMDVAAWRRRVMSRCQRKIVSGVISSRSPVAARLRYHAEQGREQGPVCPVQLRAVLLLPLQDGELVARIRISAIFHASSRRDSRSHVVTRAMRRKTNRRHMTGDHHGRTAGRATLLLTATDGNLGTHSLPAAGHPVQRDVGEALGYSGPDAGFHLGRHQATRWTYTCSATPATSRASSRFCYARGAPGST